MAAINFQALHLRNHHQSQRWSSNGEMKHVRRWASLGGSCCRTPGIKSQVSGVVLPADGLQNIESLKAGSDLERDLSRPLAKDRSTHFNDQKVWYKMMNEIRTSGDAIPVLMRHRKEKRLTKDIVIGTLVRLKQLGVWRTVMEICEWLMLQDWWQFGFEDYCLLMAAYGKEGHPEKAEALLKGFASAGFKSNIAMHTGLIEAYARKKMYHEAESCMRSLSEFGPSPTVPTYHTLMKAYTQDDRLEDADRIFCSMVGDVKPDGRSYNLIIHAYGKAGRVDRAYELYHEMKALKLNISAVTFNTLIACQKNTRNVESIFCQMKVAKVRPDVFSYTTLINIYGKAGKTEEAQDLFDEMVASGIRPTQTTYNALLDVYAKAKRVEDAEILLKRMRKDKYSPSVKTFTILVHAYALVGKMEKAEEILRRMKSENVAPNPFTFCTLMAGYASVRDPGKMMKKFNEMKAQGLQPNRAVYTVMIGASGLHDDFEASKFWFKEMVLSGCVADSRSRNALMSACKTPDQLPEARALIELCR